MNSGPTLALGSTGHDVRRLQRVLVMIKLLGVADLDGLFGAQTQTAVKAFQSGNALTADGIAGPLTWGALPADPQTPELSLGWNGSVVLALQGGLVKYGGAGSATDPGPLDGEFGPHTEAAVSAYQTQRGITADGTVGDETWWSPAGAAGATLASLAGLTTA
jgi:peptidoglycan hydrolase-like protein with peptidoglycan-binding domain